MNDAVDDVDFFAGIDKNAHGGNWSPDKEPSIELDDKPEGNDVPSGHEAHASSRENDLDKAVVMDAEDDGSHRGNHDLDFAKELEQQYSNHEGKEASAAHEANQANDPVEIVEEVKVNIQPPDTNAEMMSERTKPAQATEDNFKPEDQNRKVIESTSVKALNPSNENDIVEHKVVCTFEKEEENAKCCMECNLI
jgi:hypothetical protein